MRIAKINATQLLIIWHKKFGEDEVLHDIIGEFIQDFIFNCNPKPISYRNISDFTYNIISQLYKDRMILAKSNGTLTIQITPNAIKHLISHSKPLIYEWQEEHKKITIEEVEAKVEEETSRHNWKLF